ELPPMQATQGGKNLFQRYGSDAKSQERQAENQRQRPQDRPPVHRSPSRRNIYFSSIGHSANRPGPRSIRNTTAKRVEPLSQCSPRVAMSNPMGKVRMTDSIRPRIPKPTSGVA